MNSMIKPIALGVITYIITAIGLWFVLSLLFASITEKVLLLVPFASVIIPLFLAGYVTAINIKTNNIIKNMLFGCVSGLIGISISLLVTQAKGEMSFLILLMLGAISVSAIGGFVGSRKNVL